MKINEVKILRGPNFWSVKRHKLIQITLDIEELEFKPTDTIPGFYERIQQLLPSLYEHECSEGKPGGFFERVRRGTWMGHVIEHIAIAIQNLAGINVGFGRVRGTGQEGVYHVVVEYSEEEQGIYAVKTAIRIAEALIKGENFTLEPEIQEIKNLWINQKLGPSTASLVEEAQRRGIPYFRLDEDCLVQLGYGCKQKRVEATITSNTNIIAVDIACDKDRTKQLLTEANVPVPSGEVVTDVDKLKNAIDLVGFPVVLKPLDGNHGNGATINVTSWEEALVAFQRALKFSEKVIVEKYIKGFDFRVLVVNNKFVAAALRKPAHVTGDGLHSIRQLIELANSDPRRGEGHNNVLTRISLDDVCTGLLKKNGYTLDSVPAPGEEVYLKPTANISTGGTATDVTDEVHPSNIKLFQRIAKTIGLDICGIDVMATDLSTPIRENGGAIIEVNAAPGFRMHLEPAVGQPRNVAGPVIDMLFNSQGRIPIVAITGTNGKTTTSRLTAYIAQQSGCIVGYTTTDGVYIDDELVETGDCSGPSSARLVLRDPTVEFAVLETARGGILRSGLGFDKCSCAIVTNVAEDHLGLGGINTLERLAKVKSVVPECVDETGYAILNADDDLVYAMKDNVKCNVALFSLYSDNIRVEQHCSKGGLAAFLENGYIILQIGNHIIPVEEVQNIPITFGGKAEFNIANVLAATLAAYTNKIKVSTIRQALRTFIPSETTTPGRINIFEFNDFTVMLDYAHNPHGVRALGKFIKTFEAKTKIGVITGVGDRRDEDIVSLAEEAAKIFDEIIIRHDEDLRGRTHEEMDKLLTEGVRRVDARKPLTYYWSECEATEKAIEAAKPQSLIVILSDNYKKVVTCVKEYQNAEKTRTKRLLQAV